MKSISKLLFPTAIALLPVVLAENRKENACVTRLIRPSKLPIYEGREEIYNYEYHGKEKTQFEEGITVIRKEFESTFDATAEARDAITNFVETGKAHSLGSLYYIQDDDNLSAKIGIISVGVLSGILLGIRRGYIRKIIYSSIGAAGAASLCYPEKVVQYSNDLVVNANEYAAIGYNFVTGVKPKDFLTEIKPVKDVGAKQLSKETNLTPSAEVSKESPAEEESSTQTDDMKHLKDVLIQVSKMKPDSVSKSVGDIGQSNPADNDMYTTRD